MFFHGNDFGIRRIAAARLLCEPQGLVERPARATCFQKKTIAALRPREFFDNSQQLRANTLSRHRSANIQRWKMVFPILDLM